MMAGDGSHHVRPSRSHCSPEREASKLSVMQEEHLGLQRREELERLTPLGLAATADGGIHDGMTATFRERDQTQLGKRSWPVLIAGSTEHGGIGLGIGHILH